MNKVPIFQRLLIRIGIIPFLYNMGKWDYCLIVDRSTDVKRKFLCFSREVSYDAGQDRVRGVKWTIKDNHPSYNLWRHFVETNMVVDIMSGGKGWTVYRKKNAASLAVRK